jgi:hypothetical protein
MGLWSHIVGDKTAPLPHPPNTKKLESCTHYTWFQSHAANYKSRILGQKMWDKVRSYWENVENPLRT